MSSITIKIDADHPIPKVNSNQWHISEHIGHMTQWRQGECLTCHDTFRHFKQNHADNLWELVFLRILESHEKTHKENTNAR